MNVRAAFRAVGAVVFAVLLAGSPAFASDAERAPSDGGDTTAAPVNKLLADVVTLALQQPTAARKPGFNEWDGRLESAKTKRGKGLRLIVIGTGIGVVGPLISVALISNSGSYSGVSAGATVGLITMLGGLGTAGYGAWTWHSAKEQIDDLDREGRMKGYLTLAPIPGGALMSAQLTF
jgi:hypothetical protein